MTPITPQSQYTSVFSSSPGRSNNHRKHSLSSSSAKPFTVLTPPPPPPPPASKNPLGLNTPPSSSKKNLSSSPKKPFSFRGKKIHSFSSTNANNSTSDLLTPLEPCDEPFFAPLVNDLESPSPFSKVNSFEVSHDASNPLLLAPFPPKGPKIQPFIFTHTNQPKRTKNHSLRLRKCFICEEPLQTKLGLEKVIELTCGDYIHGDCLSIIINGIVEIFLELDHESMEVNLFIENNLPTCNGSICISNSTNCRMKPVHQNLISKIITDTLLNRNNPRSIFDLTGPNIPISTDCSIIKLPKPQIPDKSLWAPDPPLITPISSSFGDVFFDKSPRQIQGLQPLNTIKTTISTDTNFLSLRSDCLSPCQSISTSITVSVRINDYKDIPINTLKDHFIKDLIDNCPQITLTSLLNLGPLRLVDRLLISINGPADFQPKTCYLFTHYLVARSDNNQSPLFFPLDLNRSTVETPESSVLKISTTKDLNIRLHSNIDSIIEKWVAAICDILFIFPPELLTSTIILPGLANSSLNENEGAEYPAPTIHTDELDYYEESIKTPLMNKPQFLNITKQIKDSAITSESDESSSGSETSTEEVVDYPETRIEITEFTETNDPSLQSPVSKQKNLVINDDSDSDLDNETIGEIMDNFEIKLSVNKSAIDRLFVERTDPIVRAFASQKVRFSTLRIENEDNSGMSDSDIDSDAELIDEALINFKDPKNEDDWTSLQSYVDDALMHNVA
ncbi:hypothetical protein HYPBUDRAFT_152827 [Hyphopichia burtonii NRRL Y-1933]|uniref:Uncharacterized protein n=1 Tax=Hyphopichia burtonii NRRL Y-1933 TaxID=984485 RepID=A0A1E4RLV6_9ASCO|nr:hypothetical protein HYPBUDRAFT_152827 [Hyphopichia burtonii NRRL Y-1933]ODV68242.1 hypothetical protein HYPBUDRAFT_152827 [Hyphopichia burtonii NRRL Y-1933]